MNTPSALLSHSAFGIYRAALLNFANLNVTHETGIRAAFQTLLQSLAHEAGLTLVPEQKVEGTKIRPDGTLRDIYNLPRGYWEAKDTNDDLESEIQKKKRKGYPFTNILFEDTQKAVLFQNNQRVFEAVLHDPAQTATLLSAFLSYQEPDPTSFDNAMSRFGEIIPDLARGLIERIEKERADSPAFKTAFGGLLELCVETLNPNVQPAVVVEMLAQHLLTERLFRTIFDNPDFVRRNVIAHKVEETIQVMMARSFNRSDFTKALDKYYYPIESKAREATDWEQKQTFLNSLYERFFQDFSKKAADTQGIVYTPQPIVSFMLASVDSLLKSEFGTSLSHDGVVVLDPCVGTGNFMQNLVRRLSPMRLENKYRHELFCNENMLLPYYIATLNIEHAYYERTGAYEPFPGLCFTDTLTLSSVFTPGDTGKMDFFDEENAERVKAEQAADVTVIIGNPPYNVGQVSENDNNKNRAYKIVDDRIAKTYARASKATNKNALSDMYVKFFRWATDRLQGRDGIICYVSNNGFLHGIGADGMRKILADEFTTIYHLDLGGNVRRNPKLSGTTHNVFGIQVGVGITILVRRQTEDSQPKILYHALPTAIKASERLKTLAEQGSVDKMEWQTLTPDAKGNWLTEGMQASFDTFLPIGSKEGKAEKQQAKTLFKTFSNGLKSNRDNVVYDFNPATLQNRVEKFIEDYNSEVDRYIRAGRPKDVDGFVDYQKVNWSRDLKLDLQRGKHAKFETCKVRTGLYRPFCQSYLFFDRTLNEEVYTLPGIFPTPASEQENTVICITDAGSEKPFMVLATNHIPDLHIVGAGASAQCFPFYVYDEDGANRRENITDYALAAFQTYYADTDLTKQDIFAYVYALLHHAEYRTSFRANLRRELPRIPFVGDLATFRALAEAGTRLIALHTGYESAPEYSLTEDYDQQATLTDIFHVENMRLLKDKTALCVNPYLTLRGIPDEAHAYTLGSRSALEWLIDQYRVRGDSDPNRADDPQYIVRLVKRIITVSVQTVQILAALPTLTLTPAPDDAPPLAPDDAEPDPTA